MFYESSLILVRMFSETQYILICNIRVTRRCCSHCTERDILVSLSLTGFDPSETCVYHTEALVWYQIRFNENYEFLLTSIFLFSLKASFTDVRLHTNMNGESHPIKPHNSRCLNSCPVQQGPPAAHLRRALSHKNLLSLSLYTHVFPQPPTCPWCLPSADLSAPLCPPLQQLCIAFLQHRDWKMAKMRLVVVLQGAWDLVSIKAY